eukprot:13354424-Alexandrium_andersonii.AAC.1
MSASLVGSEMCIRDRTRREDNWLVLLASGRVDLLPPGAPRPSVLVGPVSYTHLTLPTICSV